MEELKKIVAKVFDVNIEMINDNLSRDTVINDASNILEQWDSFNHLLLISEIEKTLGVRFTLAEVEKINNFKTLKEIVMKKNEENQ